jgi:hypothetical protein
MPGSRGKKRSLAEAVADAVEATDDEEEHADADVDNDDDDAVATSDAPRRESRMTRVVYDGDAALGTTSSLEITHAYRLEALNGSLLEYAEVAVCSDDETPIIGVVRGAQPSLLVMNKLYGREMSWLARDDTSGELVERVLPLFSAYRPKSASYMERGANWSYKPSLGGFASDDGSQLRPLLTCGRTNDIMCRAGSHWGWRTLLWFNPNDSAPTATDIGAAAGKGGGGDDDYEPPTGIVALEALLCDVEEYETTNAQTGKTYKQYRASRVLDFERVLAAAQPIIEHATALAGAGARANGVVVLDVSDGAFGAAHRAAPSSTVSAPVVRDADDDDDDDDDDDETTTAAAAAAESMDTME